MAEIVRRWLVSGQWRRHGRPDIPAPTAPTGQGLGQSPLGTSNLGG